MAGFFGLFNYEKEGPGIYKDGPKKKTFIVFFETFFRNFWKFITVNLVYWLISIPILTNGLAKTGITNVTRNTARDKHSFGLSDFWDTLKKNFKQGLIVGIINTLVYIILFFDLWFFYNQDGLVSTIGMAGALCLLFIFTIMNYYIWTLMITFKFDIKTLYKNSFKFVVINMKNNLICFFSLTLVYAIYVGIFLLLIKYWYTVLTIELIIYVTTFAGFKHLLVQYCVFPAIKKYIIDPYYEEHPDDDIQQRKDLGLEVDEPKALEDTEENQNIFDE